MLIPMVRQYVNRYHAALEELHRLKHQVAELKASKENQQALYLEYSYTPRVRFGFGLPPHPELHKLIDVHRDSYHKFLQQLAEYKNNFIKIPVNRTDKTPPEAPHWCNGWFPGLDAISLYGILALNNPRYYIEIGAGNSTKFARKAIQDHNLRTQIVSIDPEPRAEIDVICDYVIRKPLEDVDLELFEKLSAEDVFFVDSSHRSFQNSDVTVIFTEILPILPQGMVIGFHDIFLPYDYPPDWKERYYNEQYLLACCLLSGDGFEIILPNAFISNTRELIDVLAPIWSDPVLYGIEPHGGAFWMKKKIG